MKNPAHAFTPPRTPRATIAAATLLAALTLAGCAVPVTRVTHIDEAPGRVAYRGVEYGTVRRIDLVETSEQPSGGGAVLGGLLGGVIGNQIGHGVGRGAATVLGAFGGAVLGNNIEQNQAAAGSRRHYHVEVQLDGGAIRGFDYYELNGLRRGDRVKLDHGALGRA